jgi:hypothetical protein
MNNSQKILFIIVVKSLSAFSFDDEDSNVELKINGNKI